MKKYVIFVFAALFMFATAMNAQEKKGKGPSVEVRVEKMATDLSLTDAEKTAVKTLLEKQDAEKKELSKDADRKSDEFKAKMKELNKKQGVELKAVIGDSKFAKFQEIKAAEKKEQKKEE